MFLVQLKTQITAEDYWAFVAQVNGMVAKRNGGWAGPLLVVTIGAVTGAFLPRLGLSSSLPSLIVGAVIGFASLYLMTRRQARGMTPNADGIVLGEQIIELRDQGIQVTSSKHEAIYKWVTVLSVEETPKYYFIMMDKVVGFIIPKRCFVSSEQEREFIKEVRERAGGGEARKMEMMRAE